VSEEREVTIRYSSKLVAQIREKDPQFLAMTEQWERVFGGKVEVKLEDGILVVKRNVANEIEHPNP